MDEYLTILRRWGALMVLDLQLIFLNSLCGDLTVNIKNQAGFSVECCNRLYGSLTYRLSTREVVKWQEWFGEMFFYFFFSFFGFSMGNKYLGGE